MTRQLHIPDIRALRRTTRTCIGLALFSALRPPTAGNSGRDYRPASHTGIGKLTCGQPQKKIRYTQGIFIIMGNLPDYVTIFLRVLKKIHPNIHKALLKTESLMNNSDNYAFKLETKNSYFPEIIFDIGSDETTLFYGFSHSHFDIYIYDDKYSLADKYYFVADATIEYFSDLINGKRFYEIKKKNDRIKMVSDYYFDSKIELKNHFQNYNGREFICWNGTVTI